MVNIRNIFRNGLASLLVGLSSCSSELTEAEKFYRSFPVVVDGAKHDFRDNVAEWNSKYSDNKFSLIVVTPRSLKNDKK